MQNERGRYAKPERMEIPSWGASPNGAETGKPNKYKE
jgi:hypothetical protein